MCGRYTLTRPDLGSVVDLLSADVDPSAAEIHHPRYNIAPSQPCVVASAGRANADPAGDPSGPSGITGEGRPVLSAAVWGLRLSGRFVVNLRAEASARYRMRRCVVPADGFYEWTGPAGDRRPTWFHAPSGELLLMAGLLDDRAGARPSFAILTTPSRGPVHAIHDRMPVFMGADRARRWLAGEGRAEPDPVELIATEASPRVNSAANDDASLLAPSATRQLRLC